MREATIASAAPPTEARTPTSTEIPATLDDILPLPKTPSRPRARIRAIGTAVPPRRYAQEELAQLFGLRNPKALRLFKHSFIKYRHLVLPEPGPFGMPDESIEALNAKHKHWALTTGAEAIRNANVNPEDIDFLVCVTTTGYLSPGLTAYFMKDLGFREDIHRVDVVGMGCNAAINALRPAVDFIRLNPGKRALLVCVEVCSAAYVHNETMENAVVNSLFGDAAAAVLLDGSDEPSAYPSIKDFASHSVLDAIETMRFNLDGGKLSFFLDRDIPYVIGANCHKPVERLLLANALKRRDVRHWVVHSGGKKVIDSVKMNLDLTDHDVRHTLHVLENYGNISSCACLFSLKRLTEERAPKPGDHGVLMAMGPGAAIETALLHWEKP